MKKGKMIKDAAPKNIKADQIVAIGGLTNSLCDGVVAWFQTNLPCFKSIRPNHWQKGPPPMSRARSRRTWAS